jgi:hypothetical protein
MDNTNELAALTAALITGGAHTETCQHCGAPEAGALRYKCGSYWRLNGDTPEMVTTEQCRIFTLQRTSCEALIKTLNHQSKTELVRRMFVPPTTTSGTEEWSIKVELVDVADDRKSRLNLVDR